MAGVSLERLMTLIEESGDNGTRSITRNAEGEFVYAKGESVVPFLMQMHPQSGGHFGGRNRALTKFIGYLRGKRIDAEIGFVITHAWNERFCDPPLDFMEADNLARRAWAQWGDDGLEDATPEEYALSRKEKAKPDRILMTADDLLDMDASGKGMEWLVPNVFAKQGLHYLSAPAAGAKSWLMLDLAKCVATGTQWLGQYAIQKGSVLYVDEEMGDKKTSSRVKKLEFPRGCGFYYLGKQGIQIHNASDLDYICNLCKEKQIDLVCLDTLTGVRPGLMENEASHVSALRAFFAKITDTGATLIVAHHDRKTGQGDSDVAHYRMAGSRDLGASADMAYGITRKGTYFHLEVTKNRLLAEEDAISLDFVIEDSEDKTATRLRVIEAGERSHRTSEVLSDRVLSTLRQHGKMNTTTLLDNVKGSRSVILSILTELTDRAEIVCEKVGNSKYYSVPEMPGSD